MGEMENRLKRFIKKYYRNNGEYYVITVHFIYRTIYAEHETYGGGSRVRDCFRLREEIGNAVFERYVWKTGVGTSSFFGDIERKMVKKLSAGEAEQLRNSVADALSKARNQSPEVANVFQLLEEMAHG